MKVQIRSSVQNGNLKRNRNMIIDAIASFEGRDVLITFEKPSNKRTNPQNRYYFGCLLPIAQEAFKDAWGEVWSIDKCHEFFKMHFLFHEKVNEQTGQVVKTPKSTTENTTTAQEEYHSEIRQFLSEWFNVTAPLPNEEIQLFND